VLSAIRKQHTSQGAGPRKFRFAGNPPTPTQNSNHSITGQPPTTLLPGKLLSKANQGTKHDRMTYISLWFSISEFVFIKYRFKMMDDVLHDGNGRNIVLIDDVLHA
jgi:hypothetical protein